MSTLKSHKRDPNPPSHLGLSGSAVFGRSAEPPVFSAAATSSAAAEKKTAAADDASAQTAEAAYQAHSADALRFIAAAAGNPVLARLMCQAHLKKAEIAAGYAGISLAEAMAGSEAAATAQAAPALSAIAGITLHIFPTAALSGSTASAPQKGKSPRAFTQENGGKAITFWRI